MKLSIIVCTLFATLLSTVSATSDNIVACQRDCYNAFVSGGRFSVAGNFDKLKQCRAHCRSEPDSKAEPVANETAGNPEQEEKSNDLPGSRRQLWSPAVLPPDSPDEGTWPAPDEGTSGSISIPPSVDCHVACFPFASNKGLFQQCTRDCLSDETEGKPEQEEKSNDDLPGSQHQWPPAVLPPAPDEGTWPAPDEGTWDPISIPPSVDCHVACFPFASNKGLFEQCTRDCSSKPSDESELVVNETEGKNEQEEKSNDLPGSQRQLWSPAILPPDSPDDDTSGPGRIPPAVRCHVDCFKFAANNEKFQQCTRDCLSNPSDESELVANETEDKNESTKKSNLRGSDNAN